VIVLTVCAGEVLLAAMRNVESAKVAMAREQARQYELQQQQQQQQQQRNGYY
jgi:hypothetical protein